MAKHLAGWMSPWQTGLLSGIASAGSELDKFNLMRMQNEGRIAAYQAKYGAMGATSAMKAKNDALLKQLQMEATQRSYKTQETGADGKTYDVSYRNTFNPDTGQFEPKEMGRALAKDPQALQDAREAAITDRQTNALNAGQDRADARQAGINSRLDKRDADSQAKEDQKEQAAKSDKLDARVEKDMDKFDGADSSTQASMMKAAGVKPAASDTHMFGGNTPTEDDAAANRAAYEAAITAKHAKTMGIKSPSDKSASAAPASGGQPDMTPNGQPIKYDANGQGYVQGKDGKPVPYTPDANGNAQGVPLAMDDPDASASPTAASPTGNDSEDDESGQGPGLLASAGAPAPEDMGSQESDQEDEDDDAAQDQQSQALLA